MPEAVKNLYNESMSRFEMELKLLEDYTVTDGVHLSSVLQRSIFALLNVISDKAKKV